MPCWNDSTVNAPSCAACGQPAGVGEIAQGDAQVTVTDAVPMAVLPPFTAVSRNTIDVPLVVSRVKVCEPLGPTLTVVMRAFPGVNSSSVALSASASHRTTTCPPD